MQAWEVCDSMDRKKAVKIDALLAMTLGLSRTMLGASGCLMACLLSAAVAKGQARGDMRPAEQVFKNVQVLKGIPADEFMSTMGFFSASLGISCGDCHTAESGGDWTKYADESDRKRRTRAMIGMVNLMNKNFFGGQRGRTDS